jgi:hypothetical protein
VSTARFDSDELDPSRLPRCSKDVAEHPERHFGGIARKAERPDEQGAIKVVDMPKGCPGCLPPISGVCSCGGRIAFFPISGDERFEVRLLDRKREAPRPKQPKQPQAVRGSARSSLSDAGPLFGGKS